MSWRRRPAGLVLCVAVAAVNALCWVVLTPPFQIPDEPVHVGYVQYLAETGKLPAPGPVGTYSEELELSQRVLPFSTGGDPTWIASRSALAERTLHRDLDRVQPLGAGYVAGNPPLYYLLQVVPYKLASAASPLDRLLLMRLLSVLMAGILAGFVFLFLRELMPGRPLAWRVGALGVGLHPLVGFIGGGVNPDILQWTLCAGILWLLARAFGRGLSVRLGAALGLLTAAALLTKLAMFTMTPGLAAALLLAILATPRGRRRSAVMGAGAAVLATAVPFLSYQIISEVVFGRTVAEGALSTAPGGRALNLREGMSYLWQFYLPRLPFMMDQWVGYPEYPVWDVYFKGFVGRFGWFAYDFPGWVNALALVVLGGVLAAAGAGIARARGTVWSRRLELAAYAVVAVGLLLLTHAAGYRYRQTFGFDFEQTRYLFPLLPLYGAVLGLATWAGGRSWARPAGAFLVVLAAGHNLLALALSLDRYYA